MQNKPRSIAEISAELVKKTEEHKEAEKAESYARSTTTRLVNEISDLQRELDQLVGKMKNDAPWSTKWGGERREQIQK